MTTSAMHLLAFLSLAAVSAAAAAMPAKLDAYRWKARILLVIAPGDGSEPLVQQRAIFREGARSNQERDLVLVEGVGTEDGADELRRRFGVGRGEFAAILIGKDGGEKLRSRNPISSARLFDTIDAMPMRQDEMRRQR